MPRSAPHVKYYAPTALEPLQVHLAHCRPDIAEWREIQARVNFNWHILYLLSSHEFRCMSGRVRRSEPCLYLIPPGFAYAATLNSYRHYSVHFSAERYWTYADVNREHQKVEESGWKKRALRENPVTLQMEDAEWRLINPVRHRADVATLFQELLDRYRREERFAARASLYRLLEFLRTPLAQGHAAARIQAFTDHLTHHINTDRSIAELARDCHLSRSQLNRLCRDVHGLSAKALLLQEKLTLAEVLLSRGTSVAETARACGFADPFYFSRLYRKRKGVPPSGRSALESRRY